ncbi:MAG: phage tail protein [Methylobacter sp.]|nr:MAG: phage tail protein [Methylobacter sp.]
MLNPFIGQISLFSGNFAPKGWMLCAGQLLGIAQNQALFSILGTTYGGNGIQTFALPDLRGRAVLGNGSGYVEGEASGSEQVTILISNLPPHTHALSGTDVTASSTSADAGAFGAGSGANIYATGGIPNTTMAPGAVGTAGGSQPVGIRNPYLVLSYIIAVRGIFPSRN